MDCRRCAVLSCPGTVFRQGSRQHWRKIRTPEVAGAATVLSVTALWKQVLLGPAGVTPSLLASVRRRGSHSCTQLTNVSGFFKPENPEPPETHADCRVPCYVFFIMCCGGKYMAGSTGAGWSFGKHRSGWMDSDKSRKALSSLSLWLHGHPR